MAAREHGEIHDVEQMKKIAPFFTRKTSFNQQVCNLVFWRQHVHVDLWVQVESVKQPILRVSVGSGYVSHHGTSSFDEHLDHSLVVCKNGQLRFTLRTVRLWPRDRDLTTDQHSGYLPSSI